MKLKKKYKKTKKNDRGTRATHGWHPNCFFLGFQKTNNLLFPLVFFILKNKYVVCQMIRGLLLPIF